MKLQAYTKNFLMLLYLIESFAIIIQSIRILLLCTVPARRRAGDDLSQVRHHVDARDHLEHDEKPKSEQP